MRTISIIFIALTLITIGSYLIINPDLQILTQHKNSEQKLVTYANKILQYWPPAALASGMGVPGYAKNTEYNVFILTFWLTSGASDTALIWSNPLNFFSTENPFGNTSQTIQQNILDRYHKNGTKLIVSAFGATEFPTSSGEDPVKTCTNLAKFVLENNLDGVDVDYEDNEAMELGTGPQWLIDCTKTLRQYLPLGKYILTHAPQAPYFVGKLHYPNDAYLLVDKEVGNLIDWYNVQFYNQGFTTQYNTYETLFLESGGQWNHSAVNEIIKAGVPKEKIVIGKPVTPGDATNTGWVAAGNLGTWAKQAKTSIGWDSGIMTWQYSSDTMGQFVGDYIRSSQEI